jgi:hypothetical protein
MSDQSDHDLLIRISEQIVQIRLSLDADRAEAQRRESERDAEVKDMKRDLDSLRLSRATVYGGAAALSGAISLVTRMFWK